jgi:colanic acid/amylovoran biosynthesis glycosyltransferase
VPTVAYLTNQFPAAVEWYVVEEIRELRRRGTVVIPCSARRVSRAAPEFLDLAQETLCLEPVRWGLFLVALWKCLTKFPLIADLVARAITAPGQSLSRRVRTLLHTLLGSYYALLLRGRGVEHIHVHHGYFSSWIAMVAARLLGISFSVTLHGSDLLLHPSYISTKLEECAFCLTVSEFNQRHIQAQYPQVDLSKVRVQRLGVDIPTTTLVPIRRLNAPAVLLTVGRLHAVKNHEFLLQACFQLREHGGQFQCLIAGAGPERQRLESLIRELKIENVVHLVGEVPHDEIGSYYEAADLVVLTSHSEGIPLVLMEAMAHGRVVLAPAITGIPELVIDGKTGFLYRPGVLEDFVGQAEHILRSREGLSAVRKAARNHVEEHFDRRRNLERFANEFLQQIESADRSCPDEDFVLQQI